MTFERGFRRLGWVLIALSVPLVAAIAYDRSSHVAGYEPYRLDSPFTEADSPVPGKVVAIDRLGFIHFPESFSDAEVDSYVKKHFTLASNPAAFRVPGGKMSIVEFAGRVREKHPEYTEPNNIKLAKQILTKYPEYRDKVAYSEFVLVPHSEKRPLWAAGLTVLAVAVLICIVQGGISVASWVLRGFSQRAG